MQQFTLRRWLLSGAFLLMLGVNLQAQFTVEGRVTDASGESLIGVSILAEGTSTGTVTDFDGNFTMSVPDEVQNLIMSYTGFASQTVPVRAGMASMMVVLQEDVARLEEVVVTGLASGVKRANSGNAVATITSEELTGQTQIQTLDGALNGKLAGVNISANGGAPGGGINVQLRGVSTLGAGSSQPLYIIDGVYVNNTSIRTGRSQVSGATGGASSATQDDAANRIADINPEDIERIEVLKGPSAAAIYGTRANAGVIIITTKRGEAGKTRVSFAQDIGVAQGQNFRGFAPWDEADLTARGLDASSTEWQQYQASVANGTYVDWEEALYGEEPILLNSQLSISGGGENTQFYVSGGITSEDGIIQRTGFERYSVRANVDQRLGNNIRLSLNTNYVRTDNDRGFTGNQNNSGGSLGYAIAYTPPFASLQPDENGNYPDNPYFNDNPFAIRDLTTNNQKVDRFITAAVLDIDIFSTANSFLKFRANAGVDYLSGNSVVYFPEILQHQRAAALPGDIMFGRQDALNTNLQGFFTFNTQLGSINSSTTAGVTRLDQDAEFLLQRGRGLVGGQTNLAWARNSATQQQLNSKVSDIGYVVQEDLNWEDRIIASIGVRFDKSTLNLDPNKLYAFPKASLAVNLHNFAFFNSSVFSQFKVRGAYGETGGLPLFGNTFESLVASPVGGTLGAAVGTQGVDPALVPETASEIELGLDLGLLNNRIVLEATYYRKEVSDLILQQQLAESTGVLTVATNAADLVNNGLELGLTLNPISSSKFDWTTRILYWSNDSEITNLKIPAYTVGGFGPSLGTYLIAEGFSPTTIVGNPNDGDARPESLGFSVLGDRQPDFTMSWFNAFNIGKNLEVGFLMQYQSGGEAINLSALLWDDGGNTPNYSGDDDGDGVLNGPDRLLGWAVDGNTSNYIEPTSYLKLREASIYYTIPQGVIGGDLIKRLRIGASVNNALLWTNYGSYDPEVSNFGSQAVTGNIEVTPYPSARRLFFHIKADF